MLLKYKCRRCGEISKESGGNQDIMIQQFIKLIVGQPCHISMNMAHHCKDGGLGISDIIGADPEDKELKSV